jgi:BlaI family penicillinase repressor
MQKENHMNPIPKISESEWTVMKALWAENPVTANRIVDIVSESTTWKPNTIKSLLNRLVKKGVVGYENIGRVYHYFPLIEESILVKAESQSLLKRVFGGAARPLLVTLIESEDLSDEDIEEIKRVLDKK